ncbi:glycerophosphodiester phosphodiesterase [Legionella spiritensis]|uniref:glycerophosphodiester phosphodiesterase n=1 Tax=Legionella spiritensis TaxID=452 RepID=UPI000F704F89|nr:glycerophosphodiester phosphodiesterase family protein [Legionella spiritensis]VEG91553.1 glycerophosphoryl diester phosphodiesterase [Legionella spiritensis]
MSFMDFLQQGINTLFACLPRKRPTASLANQVKLIAHRGAHDKQRHVIENTRQAFEQALVLGCWGIEFDVHATGDDVLVVNHDPTLSRLWGHDMAIRDMTFAELRALVPDMPSLEEMVSLYGRKMHLFIELKAPFAHEKKLHDTLRSLTPCEDYHLLSLDAPLFAGLTLFPKRSLLLVPEHNNVSAFCRLAIQRQYGGVMGHFLLLTHKKIRWLREAGLKVGVGFVDSRYSLYREINRGVYWVFSNKSALVSRILKDIQ